MAVQADLVFVSDLSLREENGAFVELRRLYRVTELGLTGPDILVEALDNAFVPGVNELASASILSPILDARAANLTVITRIPTAIDPDKVNIEILYEQFGGLSTDLDNLSDAPGFILNPSITGISELGVTLRTITTEFDKPFLNTNRKQIITKHKFPTDDTTLKTPGATIEQTGEIQVFELSITARINGHLKTDDPLGLARKFVGKVNSIPWASGEKRTWMCTAANPKILDRGATQQIWSVEFQFDYRDEGWDPVAVFIDPNTGKSPKNLIGATLNDDGSVVESPPNSGNFLNGGFRRVTYYEELNFNEKFPSVNDEALVNIRYI